MLIQSTDSLDVRMEAVHKEFDQNTDVVVRQAQKMLIDDIRDWAEEMRTSSSGGFDIDRRHISKLGILIFDEMLLPAQNALLKELEDIQPDVCILLLSHIHTTLIPTVLSRVVKTATDDRYLPSMVSSVFPTAAYFKKEKNVSTRIERIKKVIDAYDEEQISKQDIVVWVESLAKEDGARPELFLQTTVLLKQPSTLVKYVLEFFVGWI